MQAYYRKRLGDILVAAGLITEDQLDWALEEQRQSYRRLGEILIDGGWVSEDDIAEARALQLDIPHVQLGDYAIDSYVLKTVPESVARTYRLVPVSVSEERLAVAMVNPLDVEAIDAVQRVAHKRVEPLLASENRVTSILDHCYGSLGGADINESMQEAIDDVELSDQDIKDISFDIDEAKRQSGQAPVVRTVNLMLQEAVKRRASDIHIEPRRSCVEVRYRVDGSLQHIRNMPKALQNAVISRVKIMAELDIAERRIPQDGRVGVRVLNRNIDLRVSTMPNQFGERVVLRILDKSSQQFNIEQLGMQQSDRDKFEGLITKPYGMILVTGPTGSGKTTTLYTALNHIKSVETNIMTCEDPIEYELDGINQSQVHVRAGLTFSAQLRSILRQDPDIVLVGEIRDGETAEIAFRAALTGHLVLSTLHANDAPNTITRLIDMGVEPFLVSSAVIGVVAQRLIRTICPHCKTPYEPPINELTAFGIDPANGATTFYRGQGCNHCDNRGYLGRLGCFEILNVDDNMRRLILSRPSVDEVRKLAVEAGMVSLKQNALNKVMEGISTVEEVKKRVFVGEDSF